MRTRLKERKKIEACYNGTFLVELKPITRSPFALSQTLPWQERSLSLPV